MYLYYTQRLIKMSSSSPYLFTYRIIYTPHHRQVEKQLIILLVPRRITDGKHLLLYIVPQKLKKVNQTFLYFNRYTMYLYYITQLSVLCYCNLITNSSCKKSQNHFVRLVSSSPFSIVLSTKSGRNSTKKHQIYLIFRLRHTRRQSTPQHCSGRIP